MRFDDPFTRRGSLAKLGGALVAAAGGTALLGSGAEGYVASIALGVHK